MNQKTTPMTIPKTETARKRAVDLILEIEGPYSNDPNDPGGETRWGVTKKYYPKIVIKNKADAVKFYTDRWVEWQCDQLPIGVDVVFFDGCVKDGLVTTTKLLQNTLNRAYGCSLKEDGKLGIHTLQACESKPGLAFAFLIRRLQYMSSREVWVHYGPGWTNRLMKVALHICHA